MRFLALLGSALVVLLAASCRKSEKPPPPKEEPVVATRTIARSASSWFDLGDAHVDLGSLRTPEIGTVDVLVEWPGTPGARSFERARIVCGPTGPLPFPLEIYELDADGSDLSRQVYDETSERMKAHAWAGRPYADDAYSLACWVATRRCANEDAPWPAPATMSHIPTCRL